MINKRYWFRFWGLHKFGVASNKQAVSIRDSVIVLLKMLYHNGTEEERKHIIEVFTTLPSGKRKVS